MSSTLDLFASLLISIFGSDCLGDETRFPDWLVCISLSLSSDELV